MAWLDARPLPSPPSPLLYRPLSGRVTHLDTHVTDTHNPPTPFSRPKLKRKHTHCPVSLNVTLKLPHGVGQPGAAAPQRGQASFVCLIPTLAHTRHPPLPYHNDTDYTSREIVA